MRGLYNINDPQLMCEKSFTLIVKAKRSENNPINVIIESKTPLTIAVSKAFIETLLYLVNSWTKKMDTKNDDHLFSDRKIFT